MTARHLPAKTAQATPAVCTPETVMLPSDAASQLKIGTPRAWQSLGFETPPRASAQLLLELALFLPS